MDCVGTEATIGGKYYHDIVVWVNVRLLLEEVSYSYTSGQMQTNVGTTLPPYCTVDQRACEQDMVTYIWSVTERETCTVEQTTVFTGKTYTIGGNKELMATDQSMIALTMKGKTVKCGKCFQV